MALCEATSGARVIGLDMARSSLLAITAVAVIAIPEAQAVDTSSNAAEIERVTVTGEATDSLTSISPEESAKQKTQIPGAFTLKTAADMELGRASNFEDLLQREHQAFSFSRKTAPKFPRFQFEGPESHVKMSHSE